MGRREEMATRSTIQILAAGILAAFAASAQTYADPQKRFVLDVPAGWTSQPGADVLVIVHGGAYMLIANGTSETPDALATRLSTQFAGQWTKFQQLKRGTATLSGQSASFVFDSGVNPKGVPSFLKVTVITSQGQTFALIASAPEKEFPALKPAFDQVEQSFEIQPRTILMRRPVAAPEPVQTVRATQPPAAPETNSRIETVEHAPKTLVSFIGKGFVRGSRKTAGSVKSGVDAIRGR
jgi:hypothetical protein